MSARLEETTATLCHGDMPPVDGIDEMPEA
jgi:hypothetical protein